MSDSKTTYSSGIGFTGLLTLIFITLKLTGFIAWGWLWVLAPLWLPIIVLLPIFFIVFFVAALIAIASQPMRRRKYRIA